MENKNHFEMELDSVRYGITKNISILGSTGSIGVQALDVIEARGDLFKLRAISCNKDVKSLLEQVRRYKPSIVCVYDQDAYNEAKGQIPSDIRLLSGMEGLKEIASDPDMDVLLNSVVGNIGLIPTIEAVKNSKRIALANKETLVTSGSIVMEMAKEYGAEIIPVDSEHSAIFQALQGNNIDRVERIILTASGGPFRGWKKQDLVGVKAAQALKHPNWSMGKKISIDSSTLMNKGLEVIEAKWLFGLDPSKIDVVIHPESIIHSMVEYTDSSVMAQLGVPDMRLPIHYAFSYPDRIATKLERLDFTKHSSLTFCKPDVETFPCLQLAYDAIYSGGTMPVVLNAANEILVEKFLKGEIGFYDIPNAIETMMGKHDNIMEPTIDDILKVDRQIRKIVDMDY